MDAKELRIGNWVNYPANGENLQITSYRFEISYCYNPILLSVEILEKAGFLFSHETPHPNKVYRKEWEEGKFDLELIDTFFWGGSFCSVNVKYLHQLQNLYFALTGEELNINL